MAGRLSQEVKNRIFELDQKGFSNKDISDLICRESNRETLDRTTIFRNLRKEYRAPKKRFPTSPRQQMAWEKCNLGDHSWMELGQDPESCTVYKLRNELPKGLLNAEYGKWISTTTCWFCGFTTDPRDNYGIVWVSAE